LKTHSVSSDKECNEEMQVKSELFNMLVEDFGTAVFLREFTQRLPIIYSESYNRSYDDSLISNPFQKLYFGHSRYFLSQSLFWEVAQNTKTKSKIDYCESNGFPIVSVFKNRFRFTLHFGVSINEPSLQNASLVRKQNSMINSELVQPSLFSNEADFEYTKLRDAEAIYANIIHGCGGNGKSFADNGYIRIAIPYIKTIEKNNGKTQEKFMFVENVNLLDVLQVLIERDNKDQQNAAQPTTNIAMPKIRNIS
jgi:hypothetical protein